MWDVNVELVFVLQGIIFGNTATLLQTHTISTVIHGSFFFFFRLSRSWSSKRVWAALLAQNSEAVASEGDDIKPK